jgi:hypothetical protein
VTRPRKCGYTTQEVAGLCKCGVPRMAGVIGPLECEYLTRIRSLVLYLSERPQRRELTGRKRT